MKNIAIFIIACVSFNFFSDISIAQITVLETKKIESIKSKQSNQGAQHEKLLKQVLKSNEKIKRLLETKTAEPLIWDGSSQILTGKVLMGTLLNAVVSTNLTSPLIVQVDDGQTLSSKSKFICTGVTVHERVQAVCHKLVLPHKNKEVSVNAQLLNFDGSSGLVGYVEDEKEGLIAGAVISDFSQGVLSAASNRLTTPYGEIKDGSLKNQLFGGLIESGKSTSNMLTEEMKQAQTIISIPAGTKVIIYFMEALNESV